MARGSEARLPAPHAVLTALAPQPRGAYSLATSFGGFVFVSGQGPFAADGRIVGATFQEQAVETLRNVRGILEAAGTSMGRMVALHVYLADINDVDEFDHICRGYLDDPYPARTTLQVALRGYQIKIDAIAAMDGSPPAT